MKLKLFAAILAVCFLCGPALAQKATLTPDDVKAAIQKGDSKKAERLDLSASGWIGTTAMGVRVYTPTTWVELRAEKAHELHNDYTPSDDDLRPVLRVAAITYIRPGTKMEPNPITGRLPTCPTPTKIVLQDFSRKETVQPINAKDADTEYQNLMGAKFDCPSLYSEFPLSDLEQIRKADPRFVIVVIKNGGESEKAVEVKEEQLKRLP